MTAAPSSNDRIVRVQNMHGTRTPIVKLNIGRLGRFVDGDDVPKEALAHNVSWWRVRRRRGGGYDFLERVDEPAHVQAQPRAPATAPPPPPPANGFGKVEWAGLSFTRLGLRDGGMFRGWAGLWGLVRREVGGSLTLLCVEAADDLGNEARPGSAIWRAAVEAGADELHVAVVRGERVDRLGVRARVVRALRPVLNDPPEPQISNESRPARRRVSK